MVMHSSELRAGSEGAEEAEEDEERTRRRDSQEKLTQLHEEVVGTGTHAGLVAHQRLL